MSELFNIPGNIKQQYLPFVINPSAKINQQVTSSEQLDGASPQMFTFRNASHLQQKTAAKSGVGQLNVCPSTYKKYIKDDIANVLMYNNTNWNSKKDIDVDDILDAIPGIQIREFLPDTKLDYAINFFGKLVQKAMQLFNSSSMNGDQKATNNDPKAEELSQDADISGGSGFKKFFTSLVNSPKETGLQVVNYIHHAWNFLVCNLPKTNLMMHEGKRRVLFQTDDAYKIQPGNLFADGIVNFVYAFYYNLQTCTTTNIYELPCAIDGGSMFHSTGKEGWSDGQIEVTGENSIYGKIPIIGKIMSKIVDNIGGGLFDNIRMTYQPFWVSKDGSKTPAPEIKIQFNLFNDNLDAALINFIFVNTIIPNNKWIQYGLFQHAPSVYDVKVEGYNRLFMCSGQFDVAMMGNLRDPSKEFFKRLRKHFNTSLGKSPEFLNIMEQNKMIKIPDVYKVTMTFSSLLPDNFNTFLFNFTNNKNITNEYATQAFKKGMLTKITDDNDSIVSDFMKEMDAYYSRKGYDKPHDKDNETMHKERNYESV